MESRGLSVELTILTSTVSVHSQHNSLNTFIKPPALQRYKGIALYFLFIRGRPSAEELFIYLKQSI